jgi:prepilin-type processing-associated H-X9-DG protein
MVAEVPLTGLSFTGSHFAYADGHIAVVQEEAIVDWVDRGFDFARPQ